MSGHCYLPGFLSAPPAHDAKPCYWVADAPSPFVPQLTALPLIAAALLLILVAFINIFRTALVSLHPLTLF